MPATVTKLSVNESNCNFELEAAPYTAAANFTVPESARYAVFAVLKSDYAVEADLDVYVYSRETSGEFGTAQALAFFSARTSQYDEIAFQSRPKPGNYTVYVNACQGINGTTEVKLYSWIVSADSASNAAVPNGITSSLQAGVNTQPGVPVAARFRLNGMNPAQKYLAAVQYVQQPVPANSTAEPPETLIYLL